MRSVFLYLIDTKYEDIRAVLSSFAQPQESGPWLYPRNTSEPSLYLRISTDLSELEPAELTAIEKTLGRRPDICVAADISGRVPGKEEIRALVEYVLTRFRGVAHDDFTSHFWTHSEIRVGLEVEGHEFFDYEGWYRDSLRKK